MTGAIEFLRKAREICKERESCGRCPLVEMCTVSVENINDEADLVRKVMDYRLEDKDAERN